MVLADCIAAVVYRIAEGIAGKGQIAIEGGSNGGMLVGAVTNQRPDLFAAALPAVGVMDMLRFDRFTAGRYWVDDYGYPSKEADFKNLLAYSPYHNIKDRSEEHTSELQSLMRISYAVFCLKKKKKNTRSYVTTYYAK